MPDGGDEVTFKMHYYGSRENPFGYKWVLTRREFWYFIDCEALRSAKVMLLF